MAEVLSQKEIAPFLEGGGEMGALSRAFDWSATPVGEPLTWPQSLRSTLSIILNSRFPMFLWWGPDLIQFYNDAYRPSMGNNGKHPFALGQRGEECWPEIWPTIKPLIDQVMHEGESTWHEDQLIPIYRNGTLEDVYWTFSYSPVKGETGAVEGVLVVCNETTEKVIGRKKLEEAEEKARLAIDSAGLGTYELNLLNGKIEGSARFHAIWGLCGANNWSEYAAIMHWADIPTMEKAQLAATVTGNLHYEARLHLQHGELRWVRVSGKVLFNAEHYPHRLLGVVQDITEQKLFAEELVRQVQERTALLERAHDSLSRGNKYLQQIINKFGSALVSLLPVYENGKIVDFRFKMANLAYSVYAGMSPENLVHKKVGDVFPEYYQTNAFDKYVATYESGAANDWELHYNVDGLDVYLQIAVSKMEDELVVHFIDYTVLKNLQFELLSKIGELERSNKSLEDFAYAASHDLKEPIRKIHFFAEKIRLETGDSMTESQQRSFGRLLNAAERMASLVDDLLAYSQVSLCPRDFEPVDLEDVVKDVLYDLELEIAEKDARVSIGTLPVVKGHRVQLQQLFQNLIGNALKYHKHGEPPVIGLHASTVKGSESGLDLTMEEKAMHYFLIEVQDKGIGFENTDAEKIFHVFHRLHGNAEYRGTGVGLSIARKVVANHNGFIRAFGRPGEGSTFKIYFPVS